MCTADGWKAKNGARGIDMKQVMGLIAAVALLGIAPPVSAVTELTGPTTISAHAATDPTQFIPRPGVGYDDDSPALATDGNGVWVAVWSSDDAAAGVAAGAHSAVFVRSSDDGVTWTAPQVVRPEFAGVTGAEAALSTDGHGHWIMVWRSGSSTLVTTQSVDNGVSWQVPQTLVQHYGYFNMFPTIANDRSGTWIVAWASDDSLGGTIGEDWDILYSRSTDDGQTWSAPAYLNTNAPDPADSGADDSPRLATDGAGTWIATWDISGDTTALARSTDNGATWQAPVHVSSIGVGGGMHPDIATDRAGRWVVAWVNYLASVSTSRAIYYTLSSDGGATWLPEQILYAPHPSGSKGEDASPRLISLSSNEWQVVWTSTNSLANSIGNDFDILTSYSRDGGVTWSSPGALVARAARDGNAWDRDPVIASSPTSKTIVLWGSNDSLDGTIGDDWDILMATALHRCAAAPREDCLLPTHARASNLTIKDGSPGRNKLAWNWRYGEATTNADLGHPATTSGYAACLYDKLGSAPGLLGQWEARAGATCSGVPCWTEGSGQISYAAPRGIQGAIRKLSVRAGEDGASRIRLSANGPVLIPPRLPLSVDPSVRVQLVNDETDVCWDGTFATAKRNQATLFKATSD